MGDLTDFLEVISGIFKLVMVIAIPIVVIILAQFVRRYADRVRMVAGDRERGLLDRAVELGVKAAEQRGLTGVIRNSALKKQEAIRIAQEYLGRFGYQTDADALDDLIEAKVLTLFPPPAVLSLGPIKRAEILDKAVELAVLAAEQSALTGVILNQGSTKKMHALDFTERYLNEHGIEVDLGIIGDMIEAQLLKLFMQARRKVIVSA